MYENYNYALKIELKYMYNNIFSTMFGFYLVMVIK